VSFVLAQTQIQVDITLGGVIALIAGILILMFPRLLNFIVAIYLIVVGLIQILGL
jgi:uncharacterized membrane protein (Fun14 family)